MARQKGIIRLHGTLGGINFYERLGEPIARLGGGGFNSQSSKTYPRIRENNDEMGNASRTNRVFKQVFRSLLVGYKDGTLHYRLQSFFMRVKDLDTVSVRGQRTVANGMATPYGKRLLKDFDFTPKRPVLLNGELAFDWTTYTLTVSQFDIRNAGIPNNADLMGLTLLSVRFDFERLEWVSAESSLLELYPDFGETHFTMYTAPLTTGPGVQFAMLCVTYYQQVNGVNYLLPGDDKFGLGVVAVV